MTSLSVKYYKNSEQHRTRLLISRSRSGADLAVAYAQTTKHSNISTTSSEY